MFRCEKTICLFVCFMLSSGLVRFLCYFEEMSERGFSCGMAVFYVAEAIHRVIPFSISHLFFYYHVTDFEKRSGPKMDPCGTP